MRWVNYFLCLLRAAVALLLVRCLKAALGCYLKVAGKNTSLSLRERVGRMTILLDSKIVWLNKVLQSLPPLVVVSLLLWGLVLFACASCSAPSSLKQNFYQSQTQVERVERNGSSASLVTQPVKTRSTFLLDTWPIWGTQLYVESWGFTSDHPLKDN